MSDSLQDLQHLIQCKAVKRHLTDAVKSLMVYTKFCGAQNGEKLTLPGRNRRFHRGEAICAGL